MVKTYGSMIAALLCAAMLSGCCGLPSWCGGGGGGGGSFSTERVIAPAPGAAQIMPG
jgi:hypothetical protein